MMTGEELYALYVARFDSYNIGIDPWDDLEDNEKVVWGELAEIINARIEAGVPK